MKKYYFIILSILATAFFACSNPEADGKKAATAYMDCYEEYVDQTQKAYSDFISEFKQNHFSSRIEAREKLEKLLLNAQQDFDVCRHTAEIEKQKLEQKYLTNYEKAAKFQYAYSAVSNSHKPSNADFQTYQNNVDNLIQNIIPSKPDAEKIKADLVGHKIIEGKDGYRQQGWYWKVADNEIKELKINNIKDNGKDYVLDLHLFLESETSAYETDIIVTYVLRQSDDWTVDFIETKAMSIVKTGKYNNCITSERKQTGYTEYELEFTNHCDVALLVGGTALNAWGDKQWHKFSTVVEGNSKKRIGGLFSVSVLDYNIHFIERP
ncbi:MAG: hypothetical protein LBN27_08025 [Prevotellaceae bacterium]|jgi:hypothetical protein|nr:hypothetical protein [Prevotellaceae bacterium]